MQDIQLQVAVTERELKDALLVRHHVFVHEQQVPEELETDEYEDMSIHFIAYHLNSPIAAARIREYLGEKTAKVERVAVLKEYRGTGIGASLMVYIELEARNNGFNTLRLNAQQHAEAFYSKLGYVTISEPFIEAGIEHITMKKKI